MKAKQSKMSTRRCVVISVLINFYLLFGLAPFFPLNLSKYLRILENTDIWSSIKLIEILAIGLKNFNNIEMMNIPEFRNSPQGTFMLKS